MTTNQGKTESTVKNVAKACVASCRKLTAHLEQAKWKLLGELRGKFQAPEELIRSALNEAEALAWESGYPHLVFADLAMEKIQAIAAWHARQQSLMGRQPAAVLAA